jgi:hypothetical protein
LKLALDYDNTYTCDPDMWDKFIQLAKASGHTVYCVTMRYASEEDTNFKRIREYVVGVYFTGRKAKAKYMFDQGIDISVWIDDIPFFILEDAKH